MVLYNGAYPGWYQFAVCMMEAWANTIPYGPSIPGGLKDDRVPAVLKRPHAILGEHGMYRGTDESSAGVQAWVDADTAGIINYLKQYQGLVMAQEEDELYEVIDFKSVQGNGNLEIFVASEGWYDLGARKGNAYLVIKNESDTPANIQVFTTPFGTVPTFAIPPRSDQNSRLVVDMSKYAPTGGFATTVKSDNPNIVPQLVIWG